MMKKTAFIFAMAGLVALPAIAYAQSNDIMNRLNRMENEIQTLNRALYKGGPVPEPRAMEPDPAVAQTLTRVQQMESDLRTLTGRVEQQTYDLDQLKEQVEALSYQLKQTQMREPTPVVPQSPEMMRPDETGELLPDETGAPPQPQAGLQVPPPPQQRGMRNAAPQMPDGADPVALYEAAYNKVKSGEYEQAEQAFNQFIQRYPDHKLAGNAYYWLGETYYVRGQYAQATRTFAQSYQKFPKGPKGPDNLLKLGLSLAAEGKQKDACVALMQLSREYPAAAPEITQSAETERAKLGC